MTDDRPTHEGFTPGRWEVGDWGPEYVYGFDGKIVADCRGDEKRSLDQCCANAKLCADAPRLLAENAALRETLRRVKAELHRMPSNNRDLEAWRNAMVRNIDAALSLVQEPTR